MIVGILILIVLGVERLYHISDEYQDENVLAQQMGMTKIFSGDTAYRFVKKFGIAIFNWQLQLINGELLRNRIRKDKEKVVDADWTTIRSYENNKEGSFISLLLQK